MTRKPSWWKFWTWNEEYQAEAVVEAVFKINGAEYPGYPSIVGAAENSCILHYTTNEDNERQSSSLSDVGAEHHGYTADVTRTIPVDGTYSEEEKNNHNIVLEAQEKLFRLVGLVTLFISPIQLQLQLFHKSFKSWE